jgi:hypothetical protein
MKINTITTLELSSVCNLDCKWCINRLLVKDPARQAGIMSDVVFDRSLEVIKELVDRGTQRELNLNGNGESLLDGQLIQRIGKLRKALGTKIILMLSTNAVLVNPELAAHLHAAGINRVDVSPWKAGVVRKAIHHLAQKGVDGIINWRAISHSHNWAGQLEPENRVAIEPAGVACHPLLFGSGYIQSEGDVVPCCYDYRNLGRIGHIMDEYILEREVKQFCLCDTCHQVIAKQVVGRDIQIQHANCVS